MSLAVPPLHKATCAYPGRTSVVATRPTRPTTLSTRASGWDNLHVTLLRPPLAFQQTSGGVVIAGHGRDDVAVVKLALPSHGRRWNEHGKGGAGVSVKGVVAVHPGRRARGVIGS